MQPYQRVIDCMIDEPADVYHSKAKENLSSHQLMDFIKCPLLHRQKKLGIIPGINSAAFAMGRATHTVILEGEDQFKAEYAIGGPINDKTGRPYGDTTKKFKEWAKEQGKPVVSFDDVLIIESMRAGFAQNATAVKLISRGRAEGVIRVSMFGFNCQIRVDWLNPCEGIVDLKTTRNLDGFEEDACFYRYFNQLAFYQDVIYFATGSIVPVFIVAVEKKAPFRCGVWRMNGDHLVAASKENMAAIKELQVCNNLNQWPSGYENTRTLNRK